jgi:ArsR family transcriptional regulator
MAVDAHASVPLSVPHPNLERYDAAGELLRALTAPVRLAVIELLADHAYCVHELVDAIGGRNLSSVSTSAFCVGQG